MSAPSEEQLRREAYEHDQEDLQETYVDEGDIADVIEGDHMDDDGSDMNDDGSDMDDDGSYMDEDSAGPSSMQGEEVVLEDDSTQGFFLHKEPVFSVDLHPTQQNLVVSGGGDDRGYLWHLDTGQVVAELDKHEDSVSAVKFSRDGTFVATGGMDGKVLVFNVEKRERCATLEGPDEIQWICWHPRGNVLLAGAADASMWMWSLPNGDFMNVFNGHSAPVTCGQFTHDGKRVVSGAEDGTLIIWDPKTADVVRRFSPEDGRFHSDGITSIAISDDDNVILTGSMDGTARMVHVNGTILSAMENATESVEAVGLCSSMPLAATGSVDGSLSIWDISSNSVRLRTTLKHDDSVTNIVWHKDSPLLTSSSMDLTLRTWDARTGECLRTWKGHQEGVMDFALSNDGNTMVTASDDGCCLVFTA
ncbi:60S ribosomal subunit assembly or modification protein [Coemansia sp. RSA 552]|nr:60S ribosomal subunit assembly or modification protein [Coemansia sp. RSA 552]